MKYDLAVIGAGPAGYVGAIRAAQLGKKVCVVEKADLGGTCLNQGCIPTKALIASAAVLASAKRAQRFGVKTGEVSFDWAAVVARKDRVVRQLRGGIAALFKSHGIEVLQGVGTVLDAGHVRVAAGDGPKTEVECGGVLVATGSECADIPGIAADGRDIITHREALALAALPASMLVVGGGVMGLEFACLFSAFGVKVTVVEMLDRILPIEDAEVSAMMRQFLTRDGISIREKTKVLGMSKGAAGLEVRVEAAGTGVENLSFEKVLLAGGRRPVIDGLGLDAAGVKVARNGVTVNPRNETGKPGIWAAGDVTGRVLLAHAASEEAIVAVENYSGMGREMDYEVVPGCIYTVPEVASVGLTEEKARAAGIEALVGRFPFAASGRATGMDDTRGMVKTVLDKSTGKLLGMQIVGPEATELIMQGAMALRMGAGARDFARIAHAHPTLSEAVLESVHDAHGEAVDLPNKPR